MHSRNASKHVYAWMGKYHIVLTEQTHAYSQCEHTCVCTPEITTVHGSVMIVNHPFTMITPHPTLPYLTLPCLTLPCLTLPYLALPYLALPYLALPCLTLPCLALPCLTSPYLA